MAAYCEFRSYCIKEAKCSRLKLVDFNAVNSINLNAYQRESIFA